jgi:hypothetical protein
MLPIRSEESALLFRRRVPTVKGNVLHVAMTGQANTRIPRMRAFLLDISIGALLATASHTAPQFLR